METWDVIVIGAGACGLIAARELARSGKKVCVLEARDRIGGRVYTLPESEWGYPAQAGAEFVHGESPITMRLINEAGLHFISFDLKTVDSFNEDLSNISVARENKKHHALVVEKLRTLHQDIPLRLFLERNFADDQYKELRQQIIDRAEGYDAADTNRVSTFAIRDEWLMADEWQHGWIDEGYGTLIDSLAKTCESLDVEILLQKEVKKIRIESDLVHVDVSGQVYEAKKVLLTVPLPLIELIDMNPPIPEKIHAVQKMGCGHVIKVLFRFNTTWWESMKPHMTFVFSNERIPTWWTEYPASHPVLIGWLAGPQALKLKDLKNEEILSIALQSLANIFSISTGSLRERLRISHVANWSHDPYARGAYSYATPETARARAELLKPIDNKVFFAGEALYSGKDTGTVESAFGSGVEVAQEVLNS